MRDSVIRISYRNSYSKVVILVLAAITAFSFNCTAQQNVTPADPEYYAMDRQQMRFDDYQVMLINYRGFACPRQYSMTGFTSVQFLPISAPAYNFNLNFVDNATGKTVRDDVPWIWERWIREGKGDDPLGANFRPNSPFMMVTQDEIWQPNSYIRSGTFHKEIYGKWISFSIKSITSVSYSGDEVYLKITIKNRGDKPLNLTLVPQQTAREMVCDGTVGSDSVKMIDAFTIGSGQMHSRVSSDITNITENGFVLTLPPGEYVTSYFAVQFYRADKAAPEISQQDIALRMNKADQITRSKLKWAYDRLPKLESSDTKLQEYYYRCLLSVLMSRYENPNYITNPFWAVGYWPFTISWDNSYSSDILAMLEPSSLKEAILTDFREVKMKRTYVSWKGAYWDNLYIQEPFALQIMIEAYLRHTGDYTIFADKAGDATVWEWMQRWVSELQTNYTNKDGLIDVGYDTQKIIEIRTDGYNHVVPIVNVLTAHLLYRMSEWGILLKDKKSDEYLRAADRLKNLMNKYLWNEKEGWYDNFYPDGSKEAIWTNHLFDALGTDYLTGNQVNKLVSHLREGEFLGKYGLYSIARRDSVHWDLIDSDWGGGGQYAGMPGRVARNLYRQGFAGLGWDILKRHMGYMDYFPYLPQNPRTDVPEQDRSSMPVEISAGAGMEAIIFGTFGISIEKDILTIKPNYHDGLGVTTLRDFKFRGKSYDIQITKKDFTVFRDGLTICTKPFGEQVEFK
ncbi:MAG: hypothetical protein IPJ37_01580 [Bacteroidales bacterium]|nr:hypothetical protein [Bacteroidales bacterium]